MDTVWLMPPYGEGESKEVAATPEILTPLLVAGWTQRDPPKKDGLEVKNDVDD